MISRNTWILQFSLYISFERNFEWQIENETFLSLTRKTIDNFEETLHILWLHIQSVKLCWTLTRTFPTDNVYYNPLHWNKKKFKNLLIRASIRKLSFKNQFTKSHQSFFNFFLSWHVPCEKLFLKKKKKKKKKKKARGPRGVTANVFDCDIVVSTFKSKSRYYVNFGTIILGKGMNFLMSPDIDLIVLQLFFYKKTFKIKNKN